MKRRARSMHPVLSCAVAACLASAFTTASAQSADLAAAEAALRANNHADIVKLLLPAYRNGTLKDPRSLYILSRGCYFHRPTPMQALKQQACNNQSGRITFAAADAGNVDALLDLAVTMDTDLPSLRHPDLPQDRAKAYRAALLATQLATTTEERERANKAAANVGARLNPAAKNAVTESVNAYLAANGLAPVTTAASARSGGPIWLDAAALNTPYRYRPGPNLVKVGEDNLQAESDAGIAEEIDVDSIVRSGDSIQYVYSGMDNVVLIQANCRSGAPSLIWEADIYDAAEDGTLTFPPDYKQPIPQGRKWIEYYQSLTGKACSL